MGQAKQRGTHQERKDLAVVAKAVCEQLALDLKRGEWASLSEEEKRARIQVAALMAMGASITKGSDPF